MIVEPNTNTVPIPTLPVSGGAPRLLISKILYLFPLIYSVALGWAAMLDPRLEAEILGTAPAFVLALLSLLGVAGLLNRINKVIEPARAHCYPEKIGISVLLLIFGYNNLVCLSQVSWNFYFGHIAIALMWTGYLIVLFLVWKPWTVGQSRRALWIMLIIPIIILVAMVIGKYEEKRYRAQNRTLYGNISQGTITSFSDCDVYADSSLKKVCLQSYAETAAKNQSSGVQSDIQCPVKLDKVSIGCYASQAAHNQDFGQCDNSEFLKEYSRHKIAPSLQSFADTYALPNEAVACKFLLALEPATSIWKDYYESLPLQVVRELVKTATRDTCNKMNVGAKCDAILTEWISGGHSLSNPVQEYELSNTYTFRNWNVHYPTFPIKPEDFRQEDKRQRYEQGIYQVPNTMPARLALYVGLRPQVLDHITIQDSGSSVFEMLCATGDGDNIISYLLTAEQSSKPANVKLVTELPMVTSSGTPFTAKIYQTYSGSYATIYEFQDSGVYMFLYTDKETGYQIAKAVTK